MAKRPPLCKGIHSEMRFREQKVQRSPLLWAEWDTCHRTVLYGLMVLPVPLHSNKAETQGKCIISSLGGKNFWSEHAIGLPMIEEVRFSDTGSPFQLHVSSLPLTYPQHPEICSLGLYHGKNEAFGLRSSASSYSIIQNETKQQQKPCLAVGHSFGCFFFFNVQVLLRSF